MNLKNFLHKIRSIIEKNKASPAWLLISQLNPVIRGWVNYHRHVLAKKMFCYIDHQIWLKVWQWCVRRHPKKGKRWIRNKYFTYLTLSCYIQIAIDSYTVVKPALSKRAYKGLSGVPGNRYAPFLGEGSPAMNCPYPTSTRNFEMSFAGSWSMMTDVIFNLWCFNILEKESYSWTYKKASVLDLLNKPISIVQSFFIRTLPP